MSAVTVYNTETGDAVRVPGPDAREYIATGGWSREPVETTKPEHLMVPDGMIGKADGTPFASESAAGTARSKQDLTLTHNVVEVPGGWALEATGFTPAYTTQGEPITRG